MHEKILDERDYSDHDGIKQETLDLRLQKIRRLLTLFSAIFLACFGFVIALAYATTVRQAARIFGITEPDTMSGIFLVVFLGAFVGYIGAIINWFRYELQPYPLAWPLSVCRDALYKRANRYGIAAAVLIVAPLLIYLNFTLRQFGNLIGIRPSSQSGGTGEVLMVACMLTGFFAFIICIMQNYRAPKYSPPKD